MALPKSWQRWIEWSETVVPIVLAISLHCPDFCDELTENSGPSPALYHRKAPPSLVVDKTRSKTPAWHNLSAIYEPYQLNMMAAVVLKSKRHSAPARGELAAV